MPKLYVTPRHHHDRPILDKANPAWRCRCCGAVLALKVGDRIEIKFKRGHAYFASPPVTARCRTCTAINEWSGN